MPQVNTILCSLYVCETPVTSNLCICLHGEEGPKFPPQLFTEFLKLIIQMASTLLTPHIQTSTDMLEGDVGYDSVRRPAPWIPPVCHMKTNGCVRGR